MKRKYNINKSYALGGALSGSTTGATAGAKLGSFAGPVGTGIGAVAGGVLGAITGNAAEDAKLAEIARAKAREKRLDTLNFENNNRATLSAYNIFGEDNFNFYAKGGVINMPADYEVEGNEVVQGNDVTLQNQESLASDMTKAVGPSHENGGVAGQGGERVFSDRLPVSSFIREILNSSGIGKVKGNSYAEVAENISRKKGKYERKLASNFNPAIKTADKMIGKIDNSLDLLFDLQESENKKTNSNPKKFPDGGYLPSYLQPRQDSIYPPYQAGYVPTNILGDYSNPTGAAITNATNITNGILASPTVPKAVTGTPSVNTTANLDSPTPVEGGNSIVDSITDNLGQIANFTNFLTNKGAINNMRTDVDRTLISAPAYNYRDRSGTQRREVGRAVRQGIRSLESSSRSVNAANVGNLISRGLEATNDISFNEANRRDEYDRSYNNMILGVQGQNANIINNANDLSRDLYNQKYSFAPQQNTTAFLQGVIANADNQQRTRMDRNRMNLSFLMNNQNGVITRAAEREGLTSSEFMRRLTYGRNLLGK